jgi:hypothetical protein
MCIKFDELGEVSHIRNIGDARDDQGDAGYTELQTIIKLDSSEKRISV